MERPHWKPRSTAHRLCQALRLAVLLGVGGALGVAAPLRAVIPLNGDWQIAEGEMDTPPAEFTRHVPVPGLVDMAQPPFTAVGVKSGLRQAFWYRRTFTLPGALPAVALLKLHKAAYGTRVFLNGQVLGDHLPSFTPGYFDLRPALRLQGSPNELLVRVGAYRDAVPPSIPAGWDFEKTKYIPGLFDDVEIILSGTPHLLRVQAAPDITNRCVRVQAQVRNTGPATLSGVEFVVREAGSGAVVGRADAPPQLLPAGTEARFEATIPIARCHLWSPETPFLYRLEARTKGDRLDTRFGMREFHFDPASGRAVLNGRPYFLRGSNVTLYRFFEDPARGDRPWRADWVRRLHRAFKTMHWNSLRYCIGFPPELWYRIADEEGFLIQDEFPLWHLSSWPSELKREELAREYTEWMRERWNHPCVVLWDAQNETRSPETGPAIQMVRALDLSHRPWDNGWSAPEAPGDSFESHPYLFQNPKFRLEQLGQVSGVPGGNALPGHGTNAIIINEYGWLWLNRDGTPTTLTKQVYQNLLGPTATPAQRRHLYARYLAALTEFWRAHRACAGVLHFCGLGYSRPGGQTSDHFTDLERLTFEPEFKRYVGDAFAPVGLMIDEWAETLPAGQPRTFPVVVINDLDRPWEGSVQFRVLRGGSPVASLTQHCALTNLGSQRLSFALTLPTKSGPYQLEATLLGGGERVRSWRDFAIP